MSSNTSNTQPDPLPQIARLAIQLHRSRARDQAARRDVDNRRLGLGALREWERETIALEQALASAIDAYLASSQGRPS